MRSEPHLLHGSRRPRLLALLVLNGFGQAATAIATALLVERAFDRLIVAGSPTATSALPLAGGLAGTVLLAALLRARERIDAERLGQDYVHELRSVLYECVLSFTPRQLERRSRGAVSLRFVGDVSAVRQWVSLGLSRLLVGGCFLGGATVALAIVNFRLALVLAVVLVFGAAGTIALGRPLQRASREARQTRSRLAGLATERIGNSAVVHAFGQDERERRRMRKRSRRLRSAMIERARIIGRMRGLTEAVVGLASGAVILVGAAEVAAGRASAGTVVAAMSIVGLLASPLRDIGRVPEYWHGSRVALEKIRDLLADPSAIHEHPDAADLAPGVGRLTFEAVQLDGVLRGITAELQPGQAIALVGPNGAGKSTLLAIAGRLLDPDGGRVLIDGTDISVCTLASVRRQVGMAGPDLPLLRGTVAYNVAYRHPGASPQELARVRELCDLDALERELPEGSETRVAEDGRGLSAGQRQRIALARALLGAPSVLLLDEADANLDAQARAVVDRVIADQRRRGSVLLITHRREALERCDAVWHLADGRLVERGEPGDLLTIASRTARMMPA